MRRGAAATKNTPVVRQTWIAIFSVVRAAARGSGLIRTAVCGCLLFLRGGGPGVCFPRLKFLQLLRRYVFDEIVVHNRRRHVGADRPSSDVSRMMSGHVWSVVCLVWAALAVVTCFVFPSLSPLREFVLRELP